MGPFVCIPVDRCGQLYEVFYLFAIIVGISIIILITRLRRLPLFPIITIVLWGTTLGIIFSKLFSISLEQWIAFADTKQLPDISHKTFFGFVFGGFVGFYLVKRLLNLKLSVGEPFAYALPIGLSIGRLGCLFGGCCFGKPTNLPWAILYPQNSLAYEMHLCKGLISNGARASLPVHPAQVYEILWLIIIVVLLRKLRSFLKNPGNLFWLYIIFHSLGRFLLEFIREGGGYILGLKNLQWILLEVIFLSLLIFCRRERKKFPDEIYRELNGTVKVRAILFSLPLLFLLLRLWWWFTPLEMKILAGILILFSVLIFITVYSLLNKRYQPKFKTVTLALFMLFAGEIPDTASQSDTTKSHSYFDLSLSGMEGEYQEICGGVHHYQAAGGGVSFTRKIDTFTKERLGARGYIGYEDGRLRIIGGNLYGRAEARWIGVGAGLVGLKSLSYDGVEYLPMFSVRLGPADVFYIEGKMFDHSPGVVYGFTGLIKLGFGIGPTKDWEGEIHAGISDAGLYFQPLLPFFDNRLFLEPFLASGDENTYQLNLSIHLRLGEKRKKTDLERKR